MEDQLKCCRVCLVPEEPPEKFQSLFDRDGNYAEKIRLLSGLKVIESIDKIPQIICNDCVRQLNSADSLRLQILDAADYFSFLIKESGDKSSDKSRVKFENDEKLSEHLDLEDYEENIPVEKISRIDFKINTSAKKIPKKADKELEKQIKKTSPKLMKPDIKQSDNEVAPKKEDPEPIQPKVEINEPESYESDDSPSNMPTKRARKISSRLLESSEPAAKLIKMRIHLCESEKKTLMKPPATRKIRVKDYGATKESTSKVSPSVSPKVSPKKIKEQSLKYVQFKCETCSETFPNHPELIRHTNTHRNDETFKCFDCSEIFTEYSERVMHMQKNHPEELRKRYTNGTDEPLTEKRSKKNTKCKKTSEKI